MADYIPTTDAEKVFWLTQFAAWLTANGAAHGFTPEQIADFNTKVTESQTALNAHVTAQDAARAATVNKNEVIGGSIAMGRDYAQKLQHDLTMTDPERAAAGLIVPDPTKSATAPDAVAELTPPLLLLDFSIRHQVTIHWGPNPGNEHQNAKPHGVMGCEIQYAKGGVPIEPTGWTTLGLDTDSPLLHHIAETTPTTYTYRARYVDKKLNYGNFGDPAECTVSV
jgi:hypothetical protein